MSTIALSANADVRPFRTSLTDESWCRITGPAQQVADMVAIARVAGLQVRQSEDGTEIYATASQIRRLESACR